MSQTSPHDHDSHDHGEHPGGEDYPRLELNRLVGASQAQARMRRGWQAILLSIGLILVALGLPTERYFVGMDGLWRLTGSGPTPQSLTALPILASHWLAGLNLEAAAFLWSAILYGASLFFLVRLLQRIGFSHGVSLASTLVVMTSPLAWLGGTLPLDFSAGLLGATLLCSSLFQTKQERKQGYLWRASTYLLVAFMLQPENIWLAPAAIWAVKSQAQSGEQGSINAFGLTVVSVVCIWISVTSGGGSWTELWNSVVGLGPGSPSVLLGVAFWLSALGCAWLGLVQLVLGRREEEEQPAPTWVLAWIAVGVAPLIAGGLAQGPRGAFLLPIAAVGLGDWLTRRTQGPAQNRWAAMLVACQLLLTAGAVQVIERTNPDRDWSGLAHGLLASDDLLVTDSQAHGYLARFRHGVATCQIDAQGTEIHCSKPADPAPKGLILDAWEGPLLSPPRTPWIEAQLPPEPPLRRPTKALTKEGLIPVEQLP